jgi:glycosyltransferase involved in cell wall biosynthesis
MYTIGFVMEQSLGHITHSQNLHQYVKSDQEVRPIWGEIGFNPHGIGKLIPVYKNNWTVRSGLHARRLITSMQQVSELDALLFHTQVPAVLAQDWLHYIPTVLSLDATPLQYDELGKYYQHSRSSDLMEKVKWKLNCSCYRAASHLVTWSQWAKKGLENDYEVPSDKITVIPPGVFVADWKRPQERKIHQDRLKILFVGGDLERKGGYLLIEAFRRLKAEFPVELHLVTQTHIEREPHMYIYSDLKANNPQLKALYHSCDIFALPTFGDCLPMVLSEAGAAGMAVVSTNVAAISEIIHPDKTGLLVPIGNVDELYKALRELIEHPELRLRLGDALFAHVAQEYDSAKNSGRLLDLIKSEVDLSRVKTQLVS